MYDITVNDNTEIWMLFFVASDWKKKCYDQIDDINIFQRKKKL